MSAEKKYELGATAECGRLKLSLKVEVYVIVYVGDRVRAKVERLHRQSLQGNLCVGDQNG
jgi:hypothetical protein